MKRPFESLDLDFANLSISNKKERPTIEKHKKKQKKKKNRKQKEKQYIGGWGVGPTGKSISVSVAVALRACVRACEAVCGRVGRRVPQGEAEEMKFCGVPAGWP